MTAGRNAIPRLPPITDIKVTSSKNDPFHFHNLDGWHRKKPINNPHDCQTLLLIARDIFQDEAIGGILLYVLKNGQLIAYSCGIEEVRDNSATTKTHLSLTGILLSLMIWMVGMQPLLVSLATSWTLLAKLDPMFSIVNMEQLLIQRLQDKVEDKINYKVKFTIQSKKNSKMKS